MKFNKKIRCMIVLVGLSILFAINCNSSKNPFKKDAEESVLGLNQDQAMAVLGAMLSVPNSSEEEQCINQKKSSEYYIDIHNTEVTSFTPKLGDTIDLQYRLLLTGKSDREKRLVFPEIKELPLTLVLIDKNDYIAKKGDPNSPIKRTILTTAITSVSETKLTENGTYAYMAVYVYFKVQIPPNNSLIGDYYLATVLDAANTVCQARFTNPNAEKYIRPFSIQHNSALDTVLYLDRQQGNLILRESDKTAAANNTLTPVPLGERLDNVPSFQMKFNGVGDLKASDFERKIFVSFLNPSGSSISLDSSPVNLYYDKNVCPEYTWTYSQKNPSPNPACGSKDSNNNYIPITFRSSLSNSSGYLSFTTERPDLIGYYAFQIPISYLFNKKLADYLFTYVTQSNPIVKFRLKFEAKDKNYNYDPTGDYEGLPGTDTMDNNLAYFETTVIYAYEKVKTVTDTESFGSSSLNLYVSHSSTIEEKLIAKSSIYPGLDYDAADPYYAQSMESKKGIGISILGYKLSFINTNLRGDGESAYNGKTNKASGRVSGKVDSNFGISFSVDKNGVNVNVSETFFKKEGWVKGWEFQAGPIPIYVSLSILAEGSLAFAFDLSFPTSEPYFFKAKLGVTPKVDANFILVGAFGKRGINIGIYGKINLLGASIPIALIFAPNPEKKPDGSYSANFQNRFTIGVRLTTLDGEIGWEVTFPFIKFCYGFVPCGIEEYTITGKIWGWRGFCLFGDVINNVCTAKTVVDEIVK